MSFLKHKQRFFTLPTLALGTIFTFFAVTVSSQALSPRPAIEGYAFFGGITKDPHVGAKIACDNYDDPNHDYYVYGELRPTSYSGAGSAPLPYSYAYDCAFTDPTGAVFVGGGSYALWIGFGSTRTYGTNASNSCEATAGNPINIARGEKIQTEEDLSPIGSSPLRFKRHYTSGAKFNQYIGSFGSAWSHTYDRRIVSGSLNKTKPSHLLSWRKIAPKKYIAVTSNESANQLPAADIDYAYVVRSNGKGYYHYRSGDAWQTDYGVASNLTLLPNNVGWLFVTADNIRETYDYLGRLITIENTLGQTQTLSYERTTQEGGDDNSQTLDRVEDDEGHYLNFSYNSDGRLTQLMASTGDTYQYAYNDKGYLSQTTYPDNTTRLYHYNNSAARGLVGITDERGIRYVTWTYDSKGNAVSSEHAGGVDRVSLSYSTKFFNLSTTGSSGSVTVTNPLGKQTKYHIKAILGLPKVIKVEGYASTNCAAANQAYTYDSNGFMASKTDWQGSVTTYVHNDRGQELSRTEASGTPQAGTITTEWHTDFNLPLRVLEPERETVMSYDAYGRLVSRQIQTRGN